MLRRPDYLYRLKLVYIQGEIETSHIEKWQLETELPPRTRGDETKETRGGQNPAVTISVLPLDNASDDCNQREALCLTDKQNTDHSSNNF